MKILIADDTPEITKLIKAFLDKKGHEVDVAVDGKQALVMIKTNNYDLAFFDHNMPEMTGMELVKFIKQNKMKTRTVILSGYAGMQDSFAKIIGADDYLSKPCQLEDIDAIIKKYTLKDVLKGKINREKPEDIDASIKKHGSEEVSDEKRRKKKILIADDELHIAKLVKSRLNANGYEVLIVSNGQECLENLDSFKPDLILLDVMMPVMDGYSTIIAMKEMRLTSEEDIPDVPVLVLSARADDRIRQLIENESIKGYITKPFKAEDLLEKIKEILGEKGDNSV